MTYYNSKKYVLIKNNIKMKQNDVISSLVSNFVSLVFLSTCL